MLHIISHPFIHAVPKSPLSHSKWMALPDKIQRKISPVMDSPRHKVHFRFIFLIIKFQMANRTAQFLFPRFPGKGIWLSETKQNGGHAARCERFALFGLAGDGYTIPWNR